MVPKCVWRMFMSVWGDQNTALMNWGVFETAYIHAYFILFGVLYIINQMENQYDIGKDMTALFSLVCKAHMNIMRIWIFYGICAL